MTLVDGKTARALEPPQAFFALTSTGLFLNGQLASGCALVPGDTGLRLEVTLQVHISLDPAGMMVGEGSMWVIVRHSVRS